MTKNVPIEKLPAETRRILENLLAPDSAVILSRGGEPFGEMADYHAAPQDFELETPEEQEEIEAIAEQAHADYAAGRYVTFDAVKTRHAEMLRPSLAA